MRSLASCPGGPLGAQELPDAPQTPPEIKGFVVKLRTSRPSSERAMRAMLPGRLSEEANVPDMLEPICIPILDAQEFAFGTRTVALLPNRSNILTRLNGLQTHLLRLRLTHGLAPGKRAREGKLDMYKGRLVARGFNQVWGVQYGEISRPQLDLPLCTP